MSISPQQASDLLRSSAGDLAERVRTGDVSAAELAEAAIARIDEVDGRLNAVCVRTFERARADAAAIDHARQHGEPLGPLAGVPITIKECFHLTGTPSTIGLPRLATQIQQSDAPLVVPLRRAGGVVVGKTNVPQLMILHETDNPLYGRTSNPWDLGRSAGGSSGGEAAIIAAGGSVLGLANDLGGSIRQPAHSCGISGFRPTSGRLTNLGIVTNFNGMEAIVGQPGPMARYVADLDLAMRVLVESTLERSDPRIAPVPWPEHEHVAVDKLRVAMWEDDGYFTPCPAVRRAVREAADALRAAGVEVEPFTPPDVHEAMRYYFAIMSADGGVDARRLLAGGEIHPEVRNLMRVGRIPRWLRPPLSWLLGAAGHKHAAELMRHTGPRSASTYWRVVYERRLFIQRFFQALDVRRFDAVLCPVHSLPALKHGSGFHLTTAASYSMLTNLLGMPCGAVAATTVRPGEESDRPVSRDRAERAAAGVESGSVGLPIGVQVAGRVWREDHVLALLSVLEAHFRALPGYPSRPPL